jgi:hypothetical protein
MMALWLVTAKPLWAEVKLRPPPTAMAELIVKFVAGSEAQQVVSAAVQEGVQRNASLVRLTQTLSAQLNVPLQAQRVTSGRELVCSVDTSAVAQQVATHLERREDIQRAIPMETDPTTQGPGHRNPKVLIEFTPDSNSAKTLAKALRESPGSGPALQGLAQSVRDDLDLPLTMQPEQVQRLVLVVQMESVIAELVERLRQRSDVEYAQPTFLLKPQLGRQGQDR